MSLVLYAVLPPDSQTHWAKTFDSAVLRGAVRSSPVQRYNRGKHAAHLILWLYYALSHNTSPAYTVMPQRATVASLQQILNRAEPGRQHFEVPSPVPAVPDPPRPHNKTSGSGHREGGERERDCANKRPAQRNILPLPSAPATTVPSPEEPPTTPP